MWKKNCAFISWNRFPNSSRLCKTVKSVRGNHAGWRSAASVSDLHGGLFAVYVRRITGSSQLLSSTPGPELLCGARDKNAKVTRSATTPGKWRCFQERLNKQDN
uniref:Uncharacterized protein n=1 Tax=Anopheles stephensi TaxID=30069 RepID=A0A182YMV2_ANOST